MVKVKASCYLVFCFCGPAIVVAQTVYELGYGWTTRELGFDSWWGRSSFFLPPYPDWLWSELRPRPVGTGDYLPGM